MLAPCGPWDAEWPCDVSCLSPTATGTAVTIATDIIWALSGRRFGLCEVEIRPCRRQCYDSWPSGWSEWWFGASWPTPALIGGQWFNLICGSCGDNCSCSALSEVVMPGRVDSIVEIVIDGSPMATGSYRVDDSRILVRTDGGSWPRCNDLSKNAGESGTWSITALFGEEVPESGQWAVGELACQISRALVGEDCRLPQNITQLVRQGVTISMPDPRELFDDGLTGLYLADMFIRTYNPHGLVRRAKTYSVDGPRARRVSP
jgi:hypothetical protein